MIAEFQKSNILIIIIITNKNHTFLMGNNPIILQDSVTISGQTLPDHMADICPIVN